MVDEQLLTTTLEIGAPESWPGAEDDETALRLQAESFGLEVVYLHDIGWNGFFTITCRGTKDRLFNWAEQVLGVGNFQAWQVGHELQVEY